MKEVLAQRDQTLLEELRAQQHHQQARIEQAERLHAEGAISEEELAGIRARISSSILEHVQHEDEEVLARIAVADGQLLSELGETPLESEI